MNTKPACILALLALLCGNSPAAWADEGRVYLRVTGTNASIKIDGDHDDDWRLQVSSNLVAWSTLTNFGTLISGNVTNAPWRPITGADDVQFFRALKTDGLYDPTLFRAVHLIFTQPNWQTLLANGRTFDSNTACTVFLDNGATNFAVGARYKGNTSFFQGGSKKSINLEFDWKDTNANLMNYQTANLNNAAGDQTLMREPLYFNVMSQYTPCPRGAMCRVFINDSFWGVYALIQQENTQLIREWFPSARGDRWRTPNSGGNSAFAFLGTNISNYRNLYDLRTDNVATNIAWQRLIDAISVLNLTPTNVLREVAENNWAVDSWLWFLALENVFTDPDSYWAKGADYGFYYEPESGRMHPIEHDGNETFIPVPAELSPVMGAESIGRPLLNRFLAINELRQRYLAHMRIVLQEHYNPAVMTPVIDAYHLLTINAVIADPNKNFTMLAHTNAIVTLKSFITNRHRFLTNHLELRPLPPVIGTVAGPAAPPAPLQVPTITAEVSSSGTNGIDSVWLYFRGAAYGRFTAMQMFDDGAHGDGAAADGTYGAMTTNYASGTKVRYYVEARSANAARAASFSPPRAEHETFSYRVTVPTATNTPVLINEILASNSTIPDPQGEFDDWIELRNITDETVDLTGHYLSDEPNNPRKWQFPAGTTIPPNGYLIVWADEDRGDTPGLHASFKLSASGESLFLTDTDANLNSVLDSISFGPQQMDRSYGRSHTNTSVWVIITPTPGRPNE